MILVYPVPFICWMFILSKAFITLVGIGNTNMGDDGIGIVIVDTIKNQLSSDVDVQIWESRDALSVASELLEIETPIVIVDCADMGMKGGEFKWFHQSDCKLEQHHKSVSTHGLGFSDALALSKSLGFDQELYFFAIQPVQIEFEQEVSECLQKNMSDMSDSLLANLNELMATLFSK